MIVRVFASSTNDQLCLLVRAFYGGLTRSLAVRDLLAPASDERVLLQRENGSEVLLFELVAALAPQAINLLPARNAIRLQLKFGEPVDAVAVEVEDETGAVVFAEAALRHRPVATRRPFVESLPDFEKGGSIEELVSNGALHGAWSVLFESEEGQSLWRRRLHLHQSAAIGRDENYLVATGMLEHILLLPRNRALLSGADVRWLVLDEVRTYTGLRYKVDLLAGSDPTFEARQIEVDRQVKTGALAFWGQNSRTMCRARPFFRLGAPQQPQETSFYVFNRVENGGFRWICYQEAREQEFVAQDEELSGIIALGKGTG